MKLNNGLKKFILILFLLVFSFSMPHIAKAYEIDAVKRYNEAIDLTKNEDFEAAIILLRQAIVIDPSFLDAYYNLGIIYEHLNDRNKALEAYGELLKRNPNDDEGAFRIAAIYYGQGYYNKALNYVYLVPYYSPKYSESQELYKKITKITEEQNRAMLLKQKAAKLAAQQKAAAAKAMSVAAASKTVLKDFQGPTGITKDSKGNLYVANFTANSILQIAPDGTRKILAKNKPISGPIGLVADSSDNIYVANYLSNSVLKITPARQIITILKDINKPYYLYIDNSGMLYVSEQGKNTVIKIKI